jgi:hypothetical protein
MMESEQFTGPVDRAADPLSKQIGPHAVLNGQHALLKERSDMWVSVLRCIRRSCSALLREGHLLAQDGERALVVEELDAFYEPGDLF